MYTPVACPAGMVLRINGKFTMGILISSLYCLCINKVTFVGMFSRIS
jgi:hypothetical protein